MSGYAGAFGPRAYGDWRTSSLGRITETLERRLIFRLAGEVGACSVLDVGCGDGALALAFWRNGAARVVGCDIDGRMIARAAAEGAQQKAAIEYVVAAAEQLPFREHSFDVISVITVLAFVWEPEIALREIARVLKPGGRLVLGDLGKWSYWAASRRVRGWLGRAPMWKAARFRTAGELCSVLEKAGFRAEHVHGAIYYPRAGWIARLMAAVDPLLGELTSFGAAFLAVRATKTGGD